jgi:hypothetical protein
MEEEAFQEHIESLVSFLRCPPDLTGYNAEFDISGQEVQSLKDHDSKRTHDEARRASFSKDYKDKVQELLHVMTRARSKYGSSIFQIKRRKKIQMPVEEIEDDVIRLGLDILVHVVALHGGQELCTEYSWIDDSDVAGLVTQISDMLMSCNSVSSMEALIDCAMPDILECVSDVVIAHTEFQEASAVSVSLESYNGPSEWERVLSATVFVWLCQKWSYANLRDDERIVMMRTIALGCNDVSERVRNVSLLALYYILVMGISGNSAMKNNTLLLENLVSILKSSMVANDERCWEATYAAVGKLLEVSPRHHSVLLEEAITQAVKNQQSLIFAQQWMESLKGCFSCIGISIMQYTSRLYPVLLEWLQALHVELQCSVLDGLEVLLKICWPRNHVHVKPIWMVLDHIIDRQGGADNVDEELLRRLRSVAVLLWVTSSKDFRVEKRESHQTTDLVSWAMQACDADR